MDPNPKRKMCTPDQKDTHSMLVSFNTIKGRWPAVIHKTERIHLGRLKTIVAHMEKLKDEIFQGARQGETAEKRNNHIKLVRRYYAEASRLPVQSGYVEVPIEYRQKDGLGRYMCNGNLGLQSMTRKIRQTICRDYYHDVDIVNAHPNILLWLCRSNGIPCPFLGEYIDHRERVLKDIQSNGLRWKGGQVNTRSAAKQFVLAKVNGSSQKEALKNAEYKKYAWYLGFCSEIETIWDEMARLHPDMVAYTLKQPKKKAWEAPLHARATNRVLLNYENAILMVMNNYFERNSIPCDVLIHDGCQVQKQKGLKIEEHLRRCEALIFEETKMDTIKLSVKPMDEHLDLKSLDTPEFVDDRDRFTKISAILLKNRSDEEKAFFKQYKTRMARENIDGLTGLTGWTVRDADDLKEARRHLAADVAAPGKAVFIKAGMGVGKTHALIEYIKAHPYPYITVLTSRIAFAESVLGRYEKETGLPWEVYNNYGAKNRFASPNIVVQAESLHFLSNDRAGGLLIIDECESFLTQMTSFETHKYHRNNVEKFENLLKSSQKIVCMDAFLSEKSTAVLDHFGIVPSKFHYTIKNNPRTAKQIPLGRSCPCGARSSCVCPLVAHLIGQVQVGKKAYVVCSSVKRWREKIQPTLAKHLPNKTILEYNSRHKSTSYEDIQTAWKSADVVCVTSSITVGVDFSCKHFDLVYMCISSASRNLLRDLFQAHYRVRHLGDKKMFFSLDANTRGLGPEYPLSRYRILQKLQATEGAIARLYAAQCATTPEWLMELAVTNGLESSISVMNLEAFFKYYLKECNYTVLSPLLINGYEDIDDPPEGEVHMPLDKIPDYSFVEKEQLVSKKNGGENLSLEERWGLQKFWFKKKIMFRQEILRHYLYQDLANLVMEFEGCGVEMEAELWNYWCGSSQKFKNLKYELDNLDEKELDRWISSAKYSQGNISVLRHEFMRQIKGILHIRHTQDFGAEITRTAIEDMVAWLNSRIDDPLTAAESRPKRDRVSDILIRVFEVRNRRTNRNTDINIRGGVGLVNQILSKWGISKITKAVPKVRSRVNGRRVDTTPFVIQNQETFDIWPFLRRPEPPIDVVVDPEPQTTRRRIIRRKRKT